MVGNSESRRRGRFSHPVGAACSLGVLSEQDIDIVQRDWERLERFSEAAGALFYDRLFELDPSVRPLFKGDMAQQRVKLMRMIGSAVFGLSQPAVLIPILEHLGRKHAALGVQDQHYPTVGSALLWTLRQTLGPSFGPENQAAWTRVYDELARGMKPAA